MKKLSTLLCSTVLMFALNTTAQTAKKPVPKKITSVKTVKVKKSVKKKVQNTVTDNLVDRTIKVKLTTDSGIIIMKLYDSTPLHRDNFAKLVNDKFYDSLLFHRVIQGFMIQGGDPVSRNAVPGAMLGSGGGNMTRIPGEFRKTLFHKKGVLAAARDGNPEKASSACQFYIVQGRTYSEQELSSFELSRGRKYSPQERLAYKTLGGTPMLDQDYTVFGEVISGMEVIDKIAAVQKDQNNRPLGDVRMKMELVK
ncbi:MAG: peptidylprolyl isomerase [Ferruginibacter sp.]